MKIKTDLRRWHLFAIFPDFGEGVDSEEISFPIFNLRSPYKQSDILNE